MSNKLLRLFRLFSQPISVKVVGAASIRLIRCDVSVTGKETSSDNLTY